MTTPQRRTSERITPELIEQCRIIPLSRNKVAVVDVVDFDWLNQWKWYAVKPRNIWYATRQVRKRQKATAFYMHREILAVHDPEIHIDHRDGNGLNNRRTNLRTCTRSQNMQNQNIHTTNTSGYIGVSFRRKKWRAVINVNGKPIELGHFKDAIEAAHARDLAAIAFYGEFARLNFPLRRNSQ